VDEVAAGRIGEQRVLPVIDRVEQVVNAVQENDPGVLDPPLLVIVLGEKDRLVRPLDDPGALQPAIADGGNPIPFPDGPVEHVGDAAALNAGGVQDGLVIERVSGAFEDDAFASDVDHLPPVTS
jgi:hypothetical protein